jgi:hypothetical protein
MKFLRILVPVVLVLALLGVPAAAAGKYLSVSWWSQPDPNNPDWAENKDGSISATNVGATKVTSIAYVPAGFDAIARILPKDFEWEFDLTVPDAAATGDGWAGFYFRASQPQTGAAGLLVHINSNGLAILDGESNVPLIDERILGDIVKTNDFNHIKVACKGKEVTVWLNGTIAYHKTNTAETSGNLGFSCVNTKATYRNSVFTAGDMKEISFPVAGTEWTGVNEPVGGTPTEAPTAAVTAGTTPDVTGAAGTPTPTVSIPDPTDEDGDAGFPLWAILVVCGLVVVGAGAAGFAFATKKK